MNRGAGYLLLVLIAGCGSLGGLGASDDLPSTGVSGWRKLRQRPGTSIQEPYVLCSGGNTFRAPSAMRRADGSFAMWYVTATGAIGRATGDDGIYDWTDGGVVALPDAGPWSEVSVAEDESGLLLAASASDASRIAFFRSTDEGSTWTATGSLLASHAWEGSAIGGAELLRDEVNGEWTLFYDAADHSAIGRALSTDGATWTADAAPLFGLDEVRAAGWPIVALASPAAGLDTSRPGPPLYKIWFSGRALHGQFPFTDEWSVGYAGSFDSATGWTPYAWNPVLGEVSIDAPGLPIQFADERAATVIALGGDEYFMYFEQPFTDAVAGTTRPCIAAATIP